MKILLLYTTFKLHTRQQPVNAACLDGSVG